MWRASRLVGTKKLRGVPLKRQKGHAFFPEASPRRKGAFFASQEKRSLQEVKELKKMGKKSPKSATYVQNR